MGRPKEHGEKTRSALLAAAGEILHAEGQHAVSVRRVADAVGTSTRAVYSLFGDKDGLVRELYIQAAETMRRHHESVPVAADPIEELRWLAMAYRDAAREQPNVYDLFFSRITARPPGEDEDLLLAYRSFERVLDAVRRCVAQGLFPGRDPEATSRQMWALVHGLASLELKCVLGEPAIAEGQWHAAIDAALTGYQQP
jgi:AcrR family transcriptional regulator